jgi:hypothetical protein
VKHRDGEVTFVSSMCNWQASRWGESFFVFLLVFLGVEKFELGRGEVVLGVITGTRISKRMYTHANARECLEPRYRTVFDRLEHEPKDLLSQSRHHITFDLRTHILPSVRSQYHSATHAPYAIVTQELLLLCISSHFS